MSLISVIITLTDHGPGKIKCLEGDISLPSFGHCVEYYLQQYYADCTYLQSLPREYKKYTGTEKKLEFLSQSKQTILGDLCSLKVLGSFFHMYFVSENETKLSVKSVNSEKAFAISHFFQGTAIIKIYNRSYLISLISLT
mgnify:CR=1 FL=1